MKKVSMIALCIATVGSMSACQNFRAFNSHIRSNTIGLHREVTLYSYNGSIIDKWTIQGMIEDNGGSIRFLLDNGKAVSISGTYKIVEL